jgi:hypothetical protein
MQAAVMSHGGLNCRFDTLSSSLTSVVTAMHCPPAWAMICAVCSPEAALISATTTFAPFIAMARAVARPIPVPASVISATFPSSRAIHTSLGSLDRPQEVVVCQSGAS